MWTSTPRLILILDFLKPQFQAPAPGFDRLRIGSASGLTFVSAATDTYLYLSNVKAELRSDLEGLRDVDRIKLVGAHAVIGAGKLVYMVGTELALIAGVTGVGAVAAAIVCAIGISLDVGGQAFAGAWRMGAHERAAYDGLLEPLNRGLEALTREHPDMDSKRCRGDELSALRALAAKGELFRTIAPLHAKAFGLVTSG